MRSFFEVITVSDIICSFAAACILTYLIKGLFGGFRLFSVYGNVKVDYDSRHLKSVLNSCYELFPREMITFRGDTFKRGMRVKISTIGNRTTTGELVGANKENMICLVTAKHIIAHELSQVLDIELIDAPQEGIADDSADR